jgi:hypothetical protein
MLLVSFTTVGKHMPGAWNVSAQEIQPELILHYCFVIIFYRIKAIKLKNKKHHSTFE